MSGVKDEDAWICSCYFLHRGQTHFMASYRRTGPRPLSASGFYSFVEDWDRCSGASGHLVCRQAEFTDQAISVKVGDVKFVVQYNTLYFKYPLNYCCIFLVILKLKNVSNVTLHIYRDAIPGCQMQSSQRQVNLNDNTQNNPHTKPSAC